MAAPWVPPLCRETQSLGQHMLGLIMRIYVSDMTGFLSVCNGILDLLAKQTSYGKTENIVRNLSVIQADDNSSSSALEAEELYQISLEGGSCPPPLPFPHLI